jgi:4-alpha-glucanotransferase
MTTAQPSPASSRYVENARYYLENAAFFLDREEVCKATEMIWGSMAAAVKAAAAARERSLTTHRQLRDYAQAVAKQLEDEALFVAFREAEGMHSNFYESRMSSYDLALEFPRMRASIARFLGLVPPATTK